MSTPNEFPYKAQSDYVDLPLAPLPGDAWEGDIENERLGRGLIAAVTPVSQADSVTISANTPADEVGVYIDGALFSVPSGASEGATALLLQAELDGAAILSSIIAETSVDLAVLSFEFADDQPHTVEPYSPATTTATVASVTTAVSQQRLLFGYGVVRAPSTSANFTKVVKPSSLDDVFAGVLLRTGAADLPPEQIRLQGYDPEWLCIGQAYTLVQRDIGIMVEFVGAAPMMTDPVYHIMTGDNAGLWASSDGSVAGTSQVSTLTITSVADGNVGFNYDGLPDLAIVATANATADATSLAALWLANASYVALGSLVDNLDGTLTITFADDLAHAVTDVSTGTSAVVEAIDTPAVAGTPANAKLKEHMSWGRDSITEGDCPRAFLRLNNP